MPVTSSPRITEIIYQWYLTRVTGATNGTPLGTLKMTYWKAYAGAKIPNSTPTLDQGERIWLSNLIAGQGLTPNTNCTIGQLWQQMMAAYSLPKGGSKKDCERLFYLATAGSSP